MYVPIVTAGDGSSLASAFDEWISLIDGSGNTLSMLSTIGITLVIVGVILVFWSKRRGNAGVQKYMWMAVVGAILALPKVIIPTLLTVVDVVINLFSYAITNVVGG